MSDTERVTAPLMHAVPSQYEYFDQGSFAMLKLPYRSGASMLIFLPKKIGLDELDPLLTAANLSAWQGKLLNEKVRASLPKLELRQHLELNSVLSGLGIQRALTPAADFSGMADARLFVHRVHHATYIKVDEQGTEAAAETKTEEKSVEPPRIVDFRVNRPFVFLIRDDCTGSVLLLGRIVDPRGNAK